MTTLITGVPERNIAGAVPTAPVARRLAIRLLEAGDSVRVLVPVSEAHDWPETVEVVVGDILAAVVVAAMSDDRYSGRILEASGEPVSASERIRIIRETLARDIPFQEISPDEALKLWSRQGWSEDVTEVSLNARAAFLAQPPEADPTVEQVLGRPPTGFKRWFSRHIDKFQ